MIEHPEDGAGAAVDGADDGFGELLGIVADDGALADEPAGDRTEPELPDLLHVRQHPAGADARIALEDLRARLLDIDQDVIEDRDARLAEDGFDMVARRKLGGLPR